jgi:hypothetical protein
VSIIAQKQKVNETFLNLPKDTLVKTHGGVKQGDSCLKSAYWGTMAVVLSRRYPQLKTRRMTSETSTGREILNFRTRSAREGLSMLRSRNPKIPR